MPDHRLTALVVDDDQVSKLVLERMLVSMGFDVVLADDLAPAVALIRTQEFDAVLADFDLPGGTGIDLLDQLNLLANPPAFILVSGLVGLGELADPDTSGLIERLTKPVSTGALRRGVSNALMGRQR